MPTLLCFGDSNTFGYAPTDVLPSPYPRISNRWPVILAEKLGWTLVEEGLPGRTFAFPDPEKGPHMDGRLGLFIALESHSPIDALLIMLGTNDLKTHFDAAPEEIAAAAGFHLDVALSEEMQNAQGGFEPILVIPPMPKATGVFTEAFDGVEAKTETLRAALMEAAQSRDIACFDAGSVIATSDLDGIHFDEAAHLKLGQALAEFIAAEIEE